MKLNKILQFLGVFGAASLLLTACIKEEDNLKEMGDNVGNSFVKFLEAPEQIHYFSPFTDERTVDLFTLRKEANGNSALKTASAITITSNPDLIEEYNDENSTSYELLPDSLYTLTNSSFVKTASGYTVNFAPGEFSKEFTIKLNGAKWDISHTYALAFTITDSANLDINEGKKEIVAMVSVKNQWDGVYEVTGTLVDNAVPTITGYYPLTWDLVTAGPTKIVVWDNTDLGGVGHIIQSGPDLSYYGSFGLELTIDPVTNKITNLVNWYGQPAANGRSAKLDPDFDNRYDPDTQTFYIRYFMLQPGTTVRTTFQEVWKFTKDR
ncbi:DUF1735 domain-containing protein [Paracnuella aquatica]|uniref:DUF1735 domain-containing protein n=1 Tax=Paracnuella aquatica TaxID=2268757 RepID=UPI000F5028A4|nr:DUF1735 domain-containing protein [Paracnuella aquatica]RPD50552.1 DUF1735 domain-containing protein [Paracnuella aquatica]